MLYCCSRFHFYFFFDLELFKILLSVHSFSKNKFNDIANFTIIGTRIGIGKTILSFKNQIEGAKGMIFKKAKDLTLEGFTVQNINSARRSGGIDLRMDF
jgi:hypothetical protein